MSYLSLKPENIPTAQPKSLADEEILQISVSKNPELFSEIVHRYRDAFFRKAVSILRNESAAEDAVQEAFVKIYIKGARFKSLPGASFQSWGYKILINTCLTLYRKLSRQYVHEAGTIEDFDVETSHRSGYESRLSLDAFFSVLSRLPEQCVSVLRNVVVFGKTTKDIALEERVSEGAVRTRLHRAKKMFEKVRVEMI